MMMISLVKMPILMSVLMFSISFDLVLSIYNCFFFSIKVSEKHVSHGVLMSVKI